jgi:hypothetical protein
LSGHGAFGAGRSHAYTLKTGPEIDPFQVLELSTLPGNMSENLRIPGQEQAQNEEDKPPKPVDCLVSP